MAEEELKIDDEIDAKGSNKLLVIVAAALLGLGAGSIGAYFLLGGESSEEEVAEQSEEALPAQAMYLKLAKPFIVNFQTKGKQRYLQLDVTLKGRDQKAFDMITKHEPVVKNNLNQLFGAQEIAVLQTEEGRQALQQDATKVVQDFLQGELGVAGIDQVLFTNFVMQ